MAPRSLKNKSVAQTALKPPVAPVTTGPGCQRTQSTKQQLLCKSHIPVFSVELVDDISYFIIEQEKASKEQAAKDKAYQEAIRYQQRQEEILGFHKLPAQGPTHGMRIFLPLSYVDP